MLRRHLRLCGDATAGAGNNCLLRNNVLLPFSALGSWPFRVLVSAFLVSLSAGASAVWLQQSRELTGTRVSVDLWSADRSDGNRLIETVLANLQRPGLMMNPWNAETELALINREAASRAIITTPEIF